MTKTNDSNKREGIITKETLAKVLEQTKDDNVQATWHMIKVLEPAFYDEVLKAALDTKTHFRGKGLSGDVLDKISDVVVTYYIKGLLAHRNAISDYDAKKLNELYSLDYNDYCDKLIDAGLAKAKKAKAKAKKNGKVVESIEPNHEASKLEDLIDDNDQGK